MTLSYGSLLSLSCNGSGGDTKPSFQWLKDEEEIPGATFPELVISPVSQDHEGTYTCRVFNNVGTVNSRSANVRITKGKTKGKRQAIYSSVGSPAHTTGFGLDKGQGMANVEE